MQQEKKTSFVALRFKEKDKEELVKRMKEEKMENISEFIRKALRWYLATKI